MLQVNAVNCNTSWKVTLFMKFSDYKEDILKGVICFTAFESQSELWQKYVEFACFHCMQ